MYIIDRFEGDYAVCECEDGSIIQLARSRMTSTAKEGDVLIPCGDTFEVDAVQTQQRHTRIQQLMKGLFQDPEARA